MSTNLPSFVHTARCNFEMDTGKKPTRLLLGKRELGWLKNIAADYGFIVSVRSGSVRSEYMGLPVYEMDDEEFLGVA